MISKKVCMLGAFSVGKTSLVEQYVHSIFSNKYLSTVGVKISKKSFNIDGSDLTMVLWDMEGQDIYASVNMSYLRGAMGFFVVADGTRLETLDIALSTREAALGKVGNVPNYLIINKSDLISEWEITEGKLAVLEESGVKVLRTSAKEGLAVNAAFEALARDMLAGENHVR